MSKNQKYTLKNLLLDPAMISHIRENFEGFDEKHPFNKIQVFQNINKIVDLN